MSDDIFASYQWDDFGQLLDKRTGLVVAARSYDPDTKWRVKLYRYEHVEFDPIPDEHGFLNVTRRLPPRVDELWGLRDADAALARIRDHVRELEEEKAKR